MSAAAQHANIVEIELNRWIEYESGVLEENMKEVKMRLEDLEEEKTRLKMHLAVQARRLLALQGLKSNNASVKHKIETDAPQ